MSEYKKVIYWIAGVVLLLVIISPFIKKVLWLHESNQVIKIAVSSLPENFDPISKSEYFSNLINDNIFNHVFTKKNNRYFPELGDYWYDLSDSITIVTLKKNIFFHNGEPLTSNDIKLSFEMINNAERSLYRGAYEIDSIHVLNDNQFMIYHPNNGDFMGFLLFMPIYSAGQILKFDENTVKNNPIGTGPYYLFYHDDMKVILKKFKKNQVDRLYRLFDQVEFHYIPSRDEQVNQLLKGKVDFVINPPLERWTVLKNSDHINLKQNRSNISMYMMMDITRPVTPDVDLPRNPFLDARVRKAFMHAVDINAFIDNTLFGNAVPLTLPFLSGLLGNDSSLKRLEYNVEKARELMNSAGYGKGFRLKIYCIENKYYGDRELGQFLRKSLKEINVIAEIVYLPSVDFYKKADSGDLSCYVTGYSVVATDIVSPLKSLFYNNGVYRGPTNRFNFRDAYLNEVVDRSNLYPDNSDEKNKLLLQVGRYLYDNMFIIGLYSPNDIYAFSKKLSWDDTFTELKIRELNKK